MGNILGKINNQDITNPFSNNNTRNDNDAKVLYHSVLPTAYDDQVSIGAQQTATSTESITDEKNDTNNIKDNSQKSSDACIERFIDFAVELLKNRNDYVDVINKIFERL